MYLKRAILFKIPRCANNPWHSSSIVRKWISKNSLSRRSQKFLDRPHWKLPLLVYHVISSTTSYLKLTRGKKYYDPLFWRAAYAKKREQVNDSCRWIEAKKCSQRYLRSDVHAERECTVHYDVFFDSDLFPRLKIKRSPAERARFEFHTIRSYSW